MVSLTPKTQKDYSIVNWWDCEEEFSISIPQVKPYFKRSITNVLVGAVLTYVDGM